MSVHPTSVQDPQSYPRVIILILYVCLATAASMSRALATVFLRARAAHVHRPSEWAVVDCSDHRTRYYAIKLAAQEPVSQTPLFPFPGFYYEHVISLRTRQKERSNGLRDLWSLRRKEDRFQCPGGKRRYTE